MKKLLSLLVVLTMMTALLAGCGGGSDPAPAGDAQEPAAAEDGGEAPAQDAPSGEVKYKIGVASNNFNDKWQTYMLDAIREEAAKHPEFEFIFADGNEDANKQIGQVEDFITNGVDGIILVAVNTDTATPMTKACQEAGIPLVTVNRLLSNQEDATCYVGSESIDGGIMAAEMAFEITDGKGKVVVLMGPAGNEAAIKRTEGYEQVAEKFPDVEIVAQEIGNWNRDEGMQIVENWLQAGVEFDIVLSNNDEMAMGAVLALEGQNKREGVTVIGIDATIDALEFMKEGRMDGTVYQSAQGQGAGAADAIIRAVEGTLDEETIWIPYEPVTPDKVDEYIAKWQ